MVRYDPRTRTLDETLSRTSRLLGVDVVDIRGCVAGAGAGSGSGWMPLYRYLPQLRTYVYTYIIIIIMAWHTDQAKQA